MLAAIGLQSDSFYQVPAAHLFHALTAMRLSGLDYAARQQWSAAFEACKSAMLSRWFSDSTHDASDVSSIEEIIDLVISTEETNTDDR